MVCGKNIQCNILSVMRNTPSFLFVEDRMVHIFLAAEQGL